MEDRLIGNIVYICFLVATLFAVLPRKNNLKKLRESLWVHEDSKVLKKLVCRMLDIGTLPFMYAIFNLMPLITVYLDEHTYFKECNFCLTYEGIALVVLFMVILPIIMLYRLRKEYNVETHYQELFEKAQQDTRVTCYWLIFAGAIGLVSCCWGTLGSLIMMCSRGM